MTRGVVLRGIGLALAIGLGAVGLWLIVTSTAQKRTELGALAEFWALLIGGADSDFPWQGWAELSMSRVAARFDVSRMHVRRLIEAAVREGLLDHERGRVRATALFRDTIRPFFAFQLAELNAAAAATLAALPA